MSVVTRSAEFFSNGEVNCGLSGLGFLIFVTLEAKVVAFHPQENVGLVLVALNSMAGLTPGLHCRMNNRALRLVSVTAEASAEIWFD